MKSPMTVQPQGRARRRGVGALVLLAPALLVLGVPLVARASSNGCTAAPYGAACISVSGRGLRVEYVSVTRVKADPSFICNYQGRMTVTNSSGRVIEKRSSSRHKGCTTGTAWFDWDLRKDYPNNSKVCASFLEGGIVQGTACKKIHS